LAAVTGTVSGLGFNPIPTFDWSVINYNTPLVTPWFSQANQVFGALFGGLIIIAVYFSNMYYTAYLPINSADIFTNTNEAYDVTQVLTNGILDESKYQSYSPPYYSAANLVVYGTFFAMYPAMFVESCLTQWRILLDGFKMLIKTIMGRAAPLDAHDDAHCRMMKKYPETPMWWYLAISLAALALGIAVVEVYPTEAPVWAIFFAIAIGVVFLIPIGLLYATSNGLFSLNVITELVAGYAFPGKGVALMIVKSFGLNTNLQAIYFIQDQKLGHYAKLPPRATFRAQIFATLVSAFVVLGVVNWQIDNYKGLCEPAEATGTRFTCPNETIYYSASVVWGVIGPRRIFNHLYPVLKYSFLIGALIPIPFYIAKRYWNPRWLRQFSPMLFMLGMINFFAPYNLGYAIPALYVSFFFMHYIRNRYTAWFEKYVYVLTAALSAGMALSAVIIFFAVQYESRTLSWWGNDVIYAGIDGSGTAALLPLPSQGYFGDAPGTYPF
jgi:OPT family small oligopeptide transporter